ncbi:MAG: hypothetical protein HON90_09780, partial [Halobacteriovoraceae bacterium]|nr:hypothetical protein [Halobacteriovoraceae bacterium]
KNQNEIRIRKKAIKYALQSLWAKDFKYATSKRVLSELYPNWPKLPGNKSEVGTILGKGRFGFYLEQGEKIDKLNSYKIPNPAEFPEWYKKDIFLPKTYYSKNGLLKILTYEYQRYQNNFFHKLAVCEDILGGSDE